MSNSYSMLLRLGIRGIEMIIRHNEGEFSEHLHWHLLGDFRSVFVRLVASMVFGASLEQVSYELVEDTPMRELF